LHLTSAGFISGCRIIGVSLDEIGLDRFRTIARGVLDQFSTRKVSKADWATAGAWVGRVDRLLRIVLSLFV
jgi:glucose-6-phosphate 1-dehydrogenase